MRNYFYLLLAFTLTPICSFAQIFGGQLKSAKAGTIGSLNCSTATNNGTLTAGTASSNVSSVVPYTGGNGGRQNGQTVNSTGVTGLTAALTAGSFANGAGTLTYTITGIPASSGTASFALSIGGQSCTLTRTVALPVGIITALSCSTATNSGTLTQGVAAASVSSSVPYTGGNGGTYTTQSITSTGVTGLTATLAAGTLLSGSGSVTYTITGTPASAGTASFALSIGGQSCTLTRAVSTASTGCGNQSTLTDIDGNVYPVVEIGTQCWMKENLKVSKYRNGDPIPTNLSNTDWENSPTGACAIYNNDASNNTTYGKLYNWYAVADSRNLCPVGWHVPSDGEWKTLEISLGMSTTDADLTGNRGSAQNVGGKLKSTSILWTAPNSSATNESGFSGLPGGYRSFNGTYYYIGNGGLWWSSTENSSSFAWLRDLLYSGGGSIRYDYYETAGFSVRCLLDAAETGSINNLDCGGAVESGTLTQGVAAASVSSSVPYSGGNGGTYSAQTITSTGVTGLTATLAAGTLLSGSGSVTYTITGTPASAGTASFVLSIGGQSCTLTRTVNTSGSGPLNIETGLIPAGTFTMGSPDTEPERGSDEVQHQVTLSAFRMSKYEITNAQYAAFLNARSIGSNGLYALGAYPTQPLIYANTSYGLTWSGTQWQPVTGKDNFPVTNVTWYGATEFATYAGGRLPTEAEWEYACRGNTATPFSTGACLNNTQANYYWLYPLTGCTNTSTALPGQTQAVNSYSPNAYGLYNMHGNVLEWCADWYGPYPTTAQTNPTGPASGAYRVLRGGSWFDYARYCRSADRSYFGSPDTGNFIGDSNPGFRLAFAP